MNAHRFTLNKVPLEATASGALWLPQDGVLVVSDLHLGKAERIARREGRLTPPYETTETLARLETLMRESNPQTVICLGDSFDDHLSAASVLTTHGHDVAALSRGRRWIWIAGNHDPGQVDLGGTHLTEVTISGLTFRHQTIPGNRAEISGHYHPKVWLRGRGRPAFLADKHRVILPAFGLYTGGLTVTDPVFDTLMEPDAIALLTGRKIIAAPRAMLSPPQKGPLR